MGGILTKQKSFQVFYTFKERTLSKWNINNILCLTVNTLPLHKLVNAVKDTVAAYFEKRQTRRQFTVWWKVRGL
jgi:hypothetical protein